LGFEFLACKVFHRVKQLIINFLYLEKKLSDTVTKGCSYRGIGWPIFPLPTGGGGRKGSGRQFTKDPFKIKLCTCTI